MLIIHESEMAKRSKRIKTQSQKCTAEKKAKVKKNPGIFGKKHCLAVIGILLITALSFTTSLNNQFVNWDDDRNIYENRDITQLSRGGFWAQTKTIFNSTVIGNYNPLTIWTFSLEERNFGLNQPFYWHLNNLLLHLFCTFLVFRLCILLKMNWRIAGITALLFGIHPLHVESVAWVTERKDVLYGVFYLGALVQYVKYLSARKKIHLILVYGLFILSLFSKIQAVSLPLSMILIDYFMNRPLKWQRVVEKVPFFLIAFAVGILGVILLREQGSFNSVSTTYPIWVRPFIGSYSFLIYIIKSVIPFRMSPMYPYPPEAPWYFFVSMGGLPIYLCTLYLAWKKESKYFLFGFLFFTVNIVFLLQVLGAGHGFLADRFSYISFMGLFVFYAYLLDRFLLSNEKYKNAAYGLLGLMTISYGFLTFNQNKIWKNGDTLWTHVLKYYHNVALPYGNRANYRRDVGRNKEALRDYGESIRLAPNDAKQYNNRAKLYFLSSHPNTIQLALDDCEKAISLDPENAEYFINRGACKFRLRRPADAIVDFSEGIRLDPGFANGYLNRAMVRKQTGEIRGAFEDLLKYNEINPYNPNAALETGRMCYRLSEWDKTINWYSRAIGMRSNVGLFYYERALAHERKGDTVLARQDILAAQDLSQKMDPAVVKKILLPGRWKNNKK
jgi:protein O-mannosyl-transferase